MSGMLNPTKTVHSELEWPTEMEEHTELVAGGAPLRGRVIDTYGRPVQLALVMVVQGDVGGAALTDGRGRFSFVVGIGEALLHTCGRTYSPPLDQASFDIVIDL